MQVTSPRAHLLQTLCELVKGNDRLIAQAATLPPAEQAVMLVKMEQGIERARATMEKLKQQP